MLPLGLMPLTDAVFLLPERRAQPMHVGGLQVFRLPDGAGPDWVPELYQRMLASTDVAELFRRRPEHSLLTLGAWRWVRDDDVDLEYHVRHSALPRPGRVRELLALTSRLHGTLLDRNRPLWELHLIEGLEDNRFAIYAKVHHSLVDGVSALRLLARCLAASPEEEVPAFWVERARPERPSAAEVGAIDAVAQAASELVSLGPALAARATQTVLSQLPQSGAVPHTMLNVPITGSRRYAAQSWPLDQIKAVARGLGATVNDVVLAMSSSALREYLLSFDALPEESLVAMTPVSLHAADRRDETGNAIGAITASLGTDRSDPGERLETVRASMLAGKAALAGLSPLQTTALSALTVAPLALSAFGAISRWSPPPFNLVISNVAGPREALYYNGAQLEGLYPLSILLDGQALNITVTSYHGSLDFGLTGDRRALPHLQRLLGYLDTALKDLSLLAGV